MLDDERRKMLQNRNRSPKGCGEVSYRRRAEMSFSNYRHDIFPLEDMVLRRALALKVADDDWKAINAMLAPLGAKPKGGIYHRDHSWRVGLLASEIAEATGIP